MENMSTLKLETESLKKDAVALKMRYRKNNDLIRANGNADFDFYELTDCVVDYAKLIAQWSKFLDFANHYCVYSVIPEVRAVHDQMQRMLRKRKQHEFFEDQIAKDFLTELTSRAFSAEYREPEDQVIAACKKDALCMTAGIYFRIWQEQKKNPDYRYDNVSELEELKNKFALYKESVGIEEAIVDVDGNEYYGPQFGKVLEQMMDGIEKNYAYSENKEDTVEETTGSHK